jgi:hypothetical protein
MVKMQVFAETAGAVYNPIYKNGVNTRLYDCRFEDDGVAKQPEGGFESLQEANAAFAKLSEKYTAVRGAGIELYESIFEAFQMKVVEYQCTIPGGPGMPCTRGVSRSVNSATQSQPARVPAGTPSAAVRDAAQPLGRKRAREPAQEEDSLDSPVHEGSRPARRPHESNSVSSDDSDGP